MNDMETSEKSVEVKAFNVTQECLVCERGNERGNYKDTGIIHKDKHLHECTECENYKLFDKKYPRLEYEEVEIVASHAELKQAKYDDSFDDDIPF